MDLDFGSGTDLSIPDVAGGVGGSFAPPSLPSFNVPNFGADLNIGNLAGQSGIGGFNPDLNMGGVNFGSPDTYQPGSPGAPPPPGGTNLHDIGGMAKDVSSILGVGTGLAQIPLQVSALNQAARNTKIAEGAASTASRAAAPAIAASERLTPAGTNALLTGTLPPELEAAVNNQVNAVKQQLLQHLVSQGIDAATANSMIEGQIAELRNTLTLQAAEGLLGGGATTGNQAVSAAGTAGQISGNLAGAEGNSLSAANQALGRLVGAGT